MSRPIWTRFRAAAVAAGCAFMLSGCFSDSIFSGEKASRPVSSELLAKMESKGMDKNSPILVRIFKEESEFEVWKQTREGKFDLLKTYPICRWSGELGPKVKQGDRQAPEGFYMITPGLMNPNSAYYLAFNMGFPNAFDRSLNRTGANLMVHGDCSSAGCYAMTDEQIGEIFALARDSFEGGQRAFQVQAYPFHMTPLNMARHRNNPNIAFWRMLKEGNDHFEVTRQEPRVDVCDKRYVFNAIPFDPVQGFNAQRACPVFDQPIEVSEAVKEKREADNKEYEALVRRGTPTVPVLTYRDGGMNPVFAAKYPERNPMNNQQVAAANPRENESALQAVPTPEATASADTSKSESKDKIGVWLNRNSDKAAHPKPETKTASATAAPKPKTANSSTKSTSTPAPQGQPKDAQQAIGTLPGATPILSSGGFSSFH